MKKLCLAILGIMAMMGVAAIIFRLMQGIRVTNLTSNMAWGMWVAFYIYCIGLSAGSFLLSTLVYVFGMRQFEKLGRIALVSALLALFGGLTFVWIDLGHPWRFYKVFTSWQSSSVLAWESLFYLFYITAILAELWFLMRCDLATLRDRTEGLKNRFYQIVSLGWQTPEPAQLEMTKAIGMRRVKQIGAMGIPLAIGVHGGTGAIFAVIVAKPYWYSGLFPVIFLVSALVSGCGLMLFLYAWFGKKDNSEPVVYGLRNFLVLFIAIDVLLFLSDILVGTYARTPEHIDVWHAIIFGKYWYVFWCGQVALAWLIPVIISILPKTRKSPRFLGFGGLCVVIGIIAVRLNLVIPAYVLPQIKGLGKALPDPRAAYSYFPSGIEWISSIGLCALLIIGFLLAWSLLPMYEVSDSTNATA